MIPRLELLIFDFDGVVADSEDIANTALADFLTRKGRPTTVEDSIRQFMGKRAADIQIAAGHWLGRPLLDEEMAAYREETREVMRRDVVAVRGLHDFLEAHTHVDRCIASSSQYAWLEHGVVKFGLERHFGGRLTSAMDVQRGKPAPDVFLLAAERAGVRPERALVIEDSPAGIEGARAAGMTAIGFLGGSHIRAGHAERLQAAGAHMLVKDYPALAAIIAASR
jgi:HAD superfamily hydrolase (TIGR01509 family)